MASNDFKAAAPDVCRRIWTFANCEFDECRFELRVAGLPIESELKPLEVLIELLRHSGEVVTKERLLESVWPGLTVVDGSLATAISKLRKGLGDKDAQLVLTIPRIGYRIGVPVDSRRALNSNEYDQASELEKRFVPSKTAKSLDRHSWIVVAAAALAVVAGLSLAFRTKHHPRNG
jgi:DNA-binding winged helix-turn-helix (wHTH) protein